MTWPNWVDLIVLTILFTASYNGFRRGLTCELLNLVGAIVVTVLTVNYFNLVFSRLRPWVGSASPILIGQVVFWGFFLMLRVGVRLTINFLTRFLKWEPVHWLLQGMGMVLGVVRGLWWAGFCLLVLSGSGVVYLRESVERRSVSGPRLVVVARDSLEWVTDRAPGVAYRTQTLVPPMVSQRTKRR